MRTFNAQVFGAQGEERQLTLQGLTLEAIRTYLHEQGFTIKKLQEEEKVSLWDTLKNIEVGQRLKPQNRIRILRTLGQMINRGYSLENVLDFLISDEKEKDVMKFLQTLQRKSQKGYKDFHELFLEVKDYLDEEFFSILIAGQKTGTVGQNMIDYSLGKEKMLQQKSALMKTLSGKFVILGVVLIAFLVIVLFVVPQFQKLFGEKLELPLGMKIMVGLSNLLQHYSFLFFGGTAIVLFSVGLLYNFHPKVKFFLQHCVLKIPVLGELLRMIATRDFLYMIGNLISKGVSLMEAIRIIIEQTSNLCFRSVYTAIEKNLEKGRKLEQILKPVDPVLQASGHFVPVPSGYLMDSVAQAMTLGAKGGNLGDMLLEAYMTYDFQLQNRMSTAIKVIGAAISIFTYLVILFMIGSLATTLFKVMQDPTKLISGFDFLFSGPLHPILWVYM